MYYILLLYSIHQSVREHRVDCALNLGVRHVVRRVVVGGLGGGLLALLGRVRGGAARAQGGEQHGQEHEAVEHAVHHRQPEYLRGNSEVLRHSRFFSLDIEDLS